MMMAGADTEIADGKKGRKLGEEWSDWNGDPRSVEPEIDETRFTFFALAALSTLALGALVALLWYLVKPRLEQFNSFLPGIIQWSLIVLAVISLFLAVTEWVLVVTLGKSIVPYRAMERFILSVLPKAVWLGGKFGISRDRVGNSFIKVHNIVTRSYARRLSAERLLILLPRCLKKEARSRIIDAADRNEARVLTVAGGEEAREAIRQYRPHFILAIACERDLMSGIRDVAEKIPVLAIPNRRPEGPCKNTEFSLNEMEEAFRFIAERRSRNAN
jgi:hypothetical protein